MGDRLGRAGRVADRDHRDGRRAGARLAERLRDGSVAGGDRRARAGGGVDAAGPGVLALPAAGPLGGARRAGGGGQPVGVLRGDGPHRRGRRDAGGHRRGAADGRRDRLARLQAAARPALAGRDGGGAGRGDAAVGRGRGRGVERGGHRGGGRQRHPVPGVRCSAADEGPAAGDLHGHRAERGLDRAAADGAGGLGLGVRLGGVGPRRCCIWVW